MLWPFKLWSWCYFHWQAAATPITLSSITKMYAEMMPSSSPSPAGATGSATPTGTGSPALAASGALQTPSKAVPVPALEDSDAAVATASSPLTLTAKDVAVKKGFPKAKDHLLKEATLGLASFEGKEWQAFEVRLELVVLVVLLVVVYLPARARQYSSAQLYLSVLDSEVRVC